MGGFEGRDVVSIRDFSREEIEHVLKVAKRMVPYATGEKKGKSLDGRVLGCLFFEPSTRTRLSFESAMTRLGGGVVGFASPEGSSLMKGENLADSVRIAENFADVLVVRHPHEGAGRLAAEFASKPVINAGDGAGQHPTQTLLDLFTMWDARGRLPGLHVAFVGDLKYGRTVHSLAVALARFQADLTFVAPPTLQMPREVVEWVKAEGRAPRTVTGLEDVIADADVLYVTRIQKERFPDPAEYLKVAGTYRVDLRVLRDAKKDLGVMHPFPRVDEVAPEVDATRHAWYFRQAFNGVPVRMGLLSLILGATA